MSSYILDKAYSVAVTNGVGAYRVVVQGTSAGEATLPGAANAGAILGATVHSQSREGGHVAVRKAGIARVIAAGAIGVGAPVNVAGTGGDVKAINESTGTRIQCLGFAETPAGAAGDIIDVFISIHERTAP